MSLFSLKRKPKANRPPFEGLYAYAFVIFLGFAIADLTLLKLRPLALPDKAPMSAPRAVNYKKMSLLSDYKIIEQKNIFSANSKIPPALGSTNEDNSTGSDGPAVESRLPVTLLGTIVHTDPKKSVASINLKNQNKSQSVKVKEEVPRVLRIIKIERRKITFTNLNNSRKEYIEIPDDSKISFTGAKKTTPTTNSVVVQNGKFDFELKRSDIEKYTSDLSTILRQARMLPNTVNGQVQGFRFVSIQPDSIYTKLGFKVNDVIKGVNGEPINSPSKAMELYQALKSSDNLKLDVSRDGSDQSFNYDIK